MKKGFTLIELLAVIVILAIIALIAVPIVVNIINDSKKESLQRSIDLYIDTVQKRITQKNMKVKYDPERCEIQSNGNVKCYKGETVLTTTKGQEELEIEMNGKKPTEGTIRFNNNKIAYENIKLEGTYFHMDITGNKETSKEKKTEEPEEETISETEDYKGYYADVDGNGTVDGVIYADLAHPKEETTWGRSSTDYAKYSYTKGENLNEYTVSNNTYKKNDGFGENKIIKLKKKKDNPRFYVMALEDFTTEAYTTYYWYKKASGFMNLSDTSTNFGKGYENTGKMIGIWEKNGTGAGSYEGATQNNQDIWKHIKDKYNSKEKWYIPSLGEWTAFADYFTSKEENRLTHDYESGTYVANSGNYNSLYGLSSSYWSSSQFPAGYAWNVEFSYGDISTYYIFRTNYVRLGATF